MIFICIHFENSYRSKGFFSVMNTLVRYKSHDVSLPLNNASKNRIYTLVTNLVS